MTNCKICTTEYDETAKRFCPGCGNPTPAAANTSSAPAVAQAPSSAPSSATVLTIRFGAEERFLEVGGTLTIGKPGSGAQLEIDMPGVSRNPMTLEVTGMREFNGQQVPEFTVTDGGSSKGMWLSVFIPPTATVTGYAGSYIPVGEGENDMITSE